MEFLETTGRKIRHSGAPYRARSATSASNTIRSISKPSWSARSLVVGSGVEIAGEDDWQRRVARGLQESSSF